jgi:hypothetical protein
VWYAGSGVLRGAGYREKKWKIPATIRAQAHPPALRKDARSDLPRIHLVGATVLATVRRGARANPTHPVLPKTRPRVVLQAKATSREVAMGPKKKRGAKDTDAQAAAHDEPPEEDAPVKRARGKKRYADANVQDAVGGSPSTKKKNATEETVGGAKKSGSPSKAAAKAPAEKSVFPKSELRSVELPADKKLLKVSVCPEVVRRSLNNHAVCARGLMNCCFFFCRSSRGT